MSEETVVAYFKVLSQYCLE